MKISHRAFLDIEHAINVPIITAWRRYWATVSAPLTRAINVKNWTEVEKLVDAIATEHLVLDHAKHLTMMATAAYLLGVSRVKDIDGHVLTPENYKTIDRGVVQWGLTVGRNLSARLRHKLHLKLALLEHKVESKRHIFKKSEVEQELEDDPEIWDDVEELMEDSADFGVSFASLAGSLITSRVSNYGALSEMYSAGITEYRISEILDKDTCDWCESIDGRIFKVSDGVRQASAVMDVEDPDSMAEIAPWPDQDEADDDTDTHDLVDSGYQLPPYHPFCRGIVVQTDDEEAAAGARIDDILDEAEQDFSAVATDVLAQILGFASHSLKGKEYRGLGISVEALVHPAEDLLEDAPEVDAADTPKKKKKGPDAPISI